MDMSQYLDTFLEESREHMQSINDNLLALEENPSDHSLLDEVFRSAHTLKGMSATMGFTHVAELTHQMENLLHKLRSGDKQVNSEVIDILLRCLDGLEEMVGCIADGQETDFDIVPLVNELSDHGTGYQESSKAKQDNKAVEYKGICKALDFNEFEKNLLVEAKEKEMTVWHITIHIRPNCIMKSARSFMVFRNLENIGEIIKTSPSVTDIEDEQFDTSFELVVVSNEDKETIREAIVNIAEVDEPDLSEINTEQVMITPSTYIDEQQQVSKQADLKASPEEQSKKTTQIVKHKTASTVRVDIHRLDSLMNLVGELVINKTSLSQKGRATGSKELIESLEQLDRISVDLQNLVMKVRMVPIEQVFNRFPRMVRDLAKNLGKDVDLVIEGKETELDRTVIDEIGDPLVHLLRNSIDHGVESPEERIAAGKNRTATVRLLARHEGNHVIIEVDDDGKGIDPQAIKQKVVEKGLITSEEVTGLSDQEALGLIFKPSFSTAEKISDVSGRGVGLDAVRNKIESLSGECQVESVIGKGSRFRIYLPLTLAIIQALLVKIGDEVYAVPLSFIDETTSITNEQIRMVQGQEIMMLRGNPLPLVRLHKPLELEIPEYEEDRELFVVVVRRGGKSLGLIVEDLIGQQEIVIKSLGHLLGGIQGIAGAAILGNGHVALILDVTTLV